MACDAYADVAAGRNTNGGIIENPNEFLEGLVGEQNRRIERLDSRRGRERAFAAVLRTLGTQKLDTANRELKSSVPSVDVSEMTSIGVIAG
jgi:hypothetical protein